MLLVLAISVAGSLLLSLVGKWAADQWLAGGSVPILGSFAGLQYSVNHGVAFSVAFGSPWQEILIGIALLLLAWAASKAKTRMSAIGFGMILGGALGNILDRVFDGAVTDFVRVGTFPIFNVADSFITIGVVVAFLDAFLEANARRKAKRQKA